MIIPILILLLIVALAVLFFCHHQHKLKVRAHLMREAVRNRDFTFHLSLKGLFYGEKALQEALNDLGQEINKLVMQNEVESWQRLTRVLTHEIMNVTTPIQSISQAYLEHPKIQGTSLEKGIFAIHEASTHLVSFVESYRKLTQLQEPVLTQQDLRALIASVTVLYPKVTCHCNLPPVEIQADESLLRQVLINLLKNAIEAGARNIRFDWLADQLYVSNDGSPIPAEIRRDIFVPFYTTKPTGSGIGLALCRQIMAMQGGSCTLAEKAVSGYHTTFILEFGGSNSDF